MTLLFSDVDQSTELVKRLGARYGDVLAEHRRLLRRVFTEHQGVEVDTQGDAFFVAFGRAREAVTAAAAAQRAIAAHEWESDVDLRVRMGLHTCEPHQREAGYVGVGVHRAARICTLAHGGQVLLSRSTAGISDDEPILGTSLRDLGEQRLKDFDRPERVYQLLIDGLPRDFPPLRAAGEQPPLSGTVTIVMAEGRRVLGLSRELSPPLFGALITEYQSILREVMERMGGRDVEGHADTVVGAFPTAKEAVHAAGALQDAVTSHEWPHKRDLAISVGVHSGEAGIGWLGPVVLRCEALCDTAEGGQTFLSSATAALLEEEQLGELIVRDIGQQVTRGSGKRIRAFEVVTAARDDTGDG